MGTHPQPGSTIGAAATSDAPSMRILWLKTELLHPVDKGGRIRTYQMLRELKREHHVTYLTLDDGTAAPDAAERATEYCHELVRIPFRTRAKFSAGFYAELAGNLVSSLPYFLTKYRSAEMRNRVRSCVAGGDFDVIVCDFLMPTVNLPAKLPCATVLFQHNVEAMIWKRHYEVQQNALKKMYLRGQWRKARSFEGDACKRFDGVVAVSAADAEAMRRDYGITNVDTEYFRRTGSEAPRPFNLVFTGSMDWLPNEDAIRFFTAEVFPLIQKEIQEVTLTVVGRNPFPGLVELAARDPAVEVTGRVDDVRPYMERAAAYVIPLRIGGGTRLKVYEAMAMEIPIVSTSMGAEGLPVAGGSELVLADDPGAFAAGVVRVLRDEPFARGLAARAASLVRSRFGWGGVAEEFTELCQRAISEREQQRPQALAGSVA
jgi:hypothetical protein